MPQTDPILTPLSVWGILDRSVRLYRSHFRRLFTGAVLVGLVGFAINRLLLSSLEALVAQISAGGASVAGLVGALVMLVLVLLVAAVVAFVQYGVLAALAGSAYIEGRAHWDGGLGRGRLAVMGMACVLAAVLTGAGMVLVLPGLLMMVGFALVPVVAALEDRSPTDCLRRSWRLVRAPVGGGFWDNTVARIGVIWAFVLILDLLATSTWAGVVAMMPDSWKVDWQLLTPWGYMNLKVPRPGVGVLLGMGGAMLRSFFRPFGLCALVLLYYDVRTRREGLDIERALERMEAEKLGTPTDL